ncbi:DUF1302 domain-containing protein [Parendozoicomonas haliclonae]|uniref:DUF1302 domain-containing protein n=1 Tax=Parendozoicomonas haliclonae TaxID=1960125 RepID=A0A1X7ARS2_9GAMM|nr:DUF1302 domain-containing protein [Parendozoicomonas haliclonae]SMA50832.1 hypothetical protein EHSB41UT_04649 [Parendozoicomonas haliclonae]
MTRRYPLHPLSLAVLLNSALASGTAMAISFDGLDGELTGTLNTTVSAGISISTADPDSQLYSHGDSKSLSIKPGTGVGPNADNGRLNFAKGDVISNQYKGLTELSLEYRNYGFKGSVKYWYDHWLETKSGRYTEFDDSGFDDMASFSGIELLEAYGWTYFDIGNMPVDIRLGKQVLSWGESTFIQGSVNVINPVDAAAFNRPGVEIKEGLLPVEMLYGSIGLTPEVTMEAFYQLNWRPTVQDGCNTFFAATDAIQPGCGPIFTSATLSPEEQSMITPLGGNVIIDRTADKLPGDNGQWGASLKYYAEALNGTEFGLYFINYHSRLPYLSAVNADQNQFRPLMPNPLAPGFFGPAGDIDFYVPAINHPQLGTIRPAGFVQGATYHAVYPENIRLYGLSFNTSLDSGWSLSGEVTYRPNMPLQINVNDLLASAAAGGSTPADYGQLTEGYVRKPVTQLQITAINTFPQVLGASELALTGEVGFMHIGSLDDGNRYGRSALFGRGDTTGTGVCDTDPRTTDAFCTDEGYTTADSWGYNLNATLIYSSVLPGLNLMPSLSFRHDVNGYAYQPGGAFEEGQMAATLKLGAVYKDNYKADLSYTNFFGNNDYSSRDDRDFVSVSVSASF